MDYDSITKESPLQAQRNANTYAAQIAIDRDEEPAVIEFLYMTTAGLRPPHVRIFSQRCDREGGTRTYTFGFLLLDFPIDEREELVLRCTFFYPAAA